MSQTGAELQRSRRWYRWTLVLLVMVALVGFVVARRVGDALWRRHYAGQIAATWETVSAENLDSSMLRLRLLGEPGWRWLVEGLAHRRPEVQQAARQHLTLELDTWRELDSAESSRRVDQLSETLQATLPRLSVSGRRFAGTLATEMLVWPLDSQQVDPLRVVMRCEAILRARLDAVALPQEPFPVPASDDSDESPPLGDAVGGSIGSRVEIEAEDVSLRGWDVAMLGEMDTPASPLPMLDPLLEASPLPARDIDSEVGMQPGRSEGGANGESGVEAEVPPAVISSRVPGTVQGRVDGGWVSEARETHWQLLRRLHASDRIERERAESELKRRGFTAALLEIGRELTAPDASRRLAIVESLRTRRQLDPIPWLKQAAKDEDREVRRAALVALTERGDTFEASTAQRRLEQLPAESSRVR